MTLRHWPRMPALLILGVVLGLGKGLSSAEAYAQEVQQYGNVPFLSGGMGASERAALQDLARAEGMNLHLVFAETGGTFVSRVEVTLSDGEASVVLEDTTDGPWLLARLPAGEYQVRAQLREATREVTIAVPETGMEHRVITF